MSTLSTLEREIARYKADGVLSHEEIGKRLKIHRNTVSRALQRPTVQSAIQELRSARAGALPPDARGAIDAAVPYAISALVEVAVNGKSEKERVKAATWILGRAIETPTYRVEVEELPEWQIDQANRDAIQMARECNVSEIGLFPPKTRRLTVRHRSGLEVTTVYLDASDYPVQMNIVKVSAVGKPHPPPVVIRDEPAAADNAPGNMPGASPRP